MPFPVACVKNAKHCTCYTDQATEIKDLDHKICLDFVKNGIYNPYKKVAMGGDGGNSQATGEIKAQQDKPKVTTLDSKAPEPNLMPERYTPAQN